MIGLDLCGSVQIGHSSETEHSEWAKKINLSSEIQDTITVTSTLS